MKNDESSFREPEFEEIESDMPKSLVFIGFGSLLLISVGIWAISEIWRQNWA